MPGATPLTRIAGAHANAHASVASRKLFICRLSNNRIHMDIPAGANGTLRIWFEGKMLWRAADALSLLSAVIFLVYLIKRCKNESFT